jgi:hypothetical protein
MITAAEWKNFKETQIDKFFKEGSTIISGQGSWYDPEAHKLITEPVLCCCTFF